MMAAPVRIVITPYSVLAFVLVVGAAVALAAAAHRLSWWTRRMIATAPLVGAIGLLLTAAAAVNVAVPRTCADGVRNRPLLSALTGDPCRPAALSQMALVVIVGLVTTAAVRSVAARRMATRHDEQVRAAHHDEVRTRR